MIVRGWSGRRISACISRRQLRNYRESLQIDVQFHCFLQYVFHKQWQNLRAYAHENGVQIIGDVPIYVPLDSADVGRIRKTSSSEEPDARAASPAVRPTDSAKRAVLGQPDLRLGAHGAGRLFWWLQRIGAAGRKLTSCASTISAASRAIGASLPSTRPRATGAGSRTRTQAGARDSKAYPDISFIAEDLGFLTPEVLQLVLDSGWPGMKVLEFAFDPREPSNYLPHKYGENCICYTGTHDNETL